jgi:transposase
MLLVGIDWAEDEHAACLMDASGAVCRRLRVPHTVAGLRRLQGAIATLEPEPQSVHVAIERPRGLLVRALVDAGYSLYALNPKAVERYRARTRTAGAKSDPADAELLARILLTDRARHEVLHMNSPQAEEVRTIAREDERASRDERRLLNRLRQDLLDVFPEALAAFPRLTDLSALAFLARWPSAAAARQLDIAALLTFLREHQHGWPERTAARIHAALTAEALTEEPRIAQARAGTIRLAAEQLLLLHRQRVLWRKELQRLLAGDGAHPAGAVLLSLPGLDARLAARVLGEVGDTQGRFRSAAALQCYAGTAPITRASGKLRIVAARWSCNRFLRQAVLRWALCSLRVSPWARTFYDMQRGAGKTHFKALRALGNRWLEILHHLLATGQRYDEAVHERNRERAVHASAA